jgi:hypothetical protein
VRGLHEADQARARNKTKSLKYSLLGTVTYIYFSPPNDFGAWYTLLVAL